MMLFLADVVLVIHFLFMVFVVLGQVCILIGGWRKWDWVRCFRFRVAHLLAIAIVVLQDWLHMVCPLTVWENALRRAAGESGYPDTFVGYWVGRLVYYEAPAWVFTLAYTLFGLSVLASWFLVKPKPGCRL